MGPYYTTHWAKSIRPWGQFIRGEFQEECSLPLTSLDDESFREDEDPIVSLPESIFSIPDHLDPYLTAAYRQPEASWRRMLPCIPPPVELQVQHQTRTWLPRAGTLRCLRFDNSDDPHATSSGDDTRRCWLTFGLVYDIFEAAWFRSQPSAVTSWQFDWTFQDIRPRMRDPAAARPLEMPTQEELENSHLYGDREAMRDYLPDTPIGGTSRVLILFRKFSEDEQDSADSVKRFRADLELQRLDGNAFEWDEVIPYEHG